METIGYCGDVESALFIMSVFFWWFSQMSVGANPIIVPVHQLPYTCHKVGFPLVLPTGIFGCNQRHEVGLWYDFSTDRVTKLPNGPWLVGDDLFLMGEDGGWWDRDQAILRNEQAIAVVSEVGQIQGDWIFWTDVQSVSVMDRHRKVVTSREANPLGGQSLVRMGNMMAWIEWGVSMGIHVWDVGTDRHWWVQSDHPTSLVAANQQLAWVSKGDIHMWNPIDVDTEPTTKGLLRVHQVFSTVQGLCWTAWQEDVDIFCDGGFHLSRNGLQTQPVWIENKLYFLEDRKLWVWQSSR